MLQHPIGYHQAAGGLESELRPDYAGKEAGGVAGENAHCRYTTTNTSTTRRNDPKPEKSTINHNSDVDW
jgi:hypothetical protein